MVILALVITLMVAGVWFLGPWTVLKVICALILGLVVFGSGLFGVICFKAQARAWGAGLLALAALCAMGIYWLFFGF